MLGRYFLFSASLCAAALTALPGYGQTAPRLEGIPVPPKQEVLQKIEDAKSLEMPALVDKLEETPAKPRQLSEVLAEKLTTDREGTARILSDALVSMASAAENEMQRQPYRPASPFTRFQDVYYTQDEAEKVSMYPYMELEDPYAQDSYLRMMQLAMEVGQSGASSILFSVFQADPGAAQTPAMKAGAMFVENMQAHMSEAVYNIMAVHAMEDFSTRYYLDTGRLRKEDVQPVNMEDRAALETRYATWRAMIDTAVQLGQETDIPMLQHLQVRYDYYDWYDQKFTYSAATIQPVYESEDEAHTLFLQGGYKVKQRSETTGGGVAYRHIAPAAGVMIGVNAFQQRQKLTPYDYGDDWFGFEAEKPGDQTIDRTSAGMEFGTEYLQLSANRYWADHQLTEHNYWDYEDYQGNGYDFQLVSLLPFMPEVSFRAKTYQFDYHQYERDLKGREFMVMYIPNPVFRARAYAVDTNYRDEPAAYIEARVTLQFGVPLEDQLNGAVNRPAAQGVTGMRLQKLHQDDFLTIY